MSNGNGNASNVTRWLHAADAIKTPAQWRGEVDTWRARAESLAVERAALLSELEAARERDAARAAQNDAQWCELVETTGTILATSDRYRLHLHGDAPAPALVNELVASLETRWRDDLRRIVELATRAAAAAHIPLDLAAGRPASFYVSTLLEQLTSHAREDRGAEEPQRELVEIPSPHQERSAR